MKKIFKGLSVIMITVFLCSGCISKFTKENYFKNSTGIAKSDYKALEIIEQLKHAKIPVVVDMQRKSNFSDINIMVANKDLFNPGSANFNANALDVLDKIIALLNCYEEDTVKVQSGSGEVNAHNRYQKALALAQAHSVVRYMWSQDVNASLVYAAAEKENAGAITITFSGYRL